MTNENVSYKTLERFRTKLIEDINNKLTEQQRQFLLSIKKGKPNWLLTPFEKLINFPALQWKLNNIKKMNPQKHSAAVDQLKRILKL